MALPDFLTPRRAKGGLDSSIASGYAMLDRNHFCRGCSVPGALLEG